MSFYFSTLAPFVSSTVQFYVRAYRSPALRSFLRNVLIIVLVLIAFYALLLRDLVRWFVCTLYRSFLSIVDACEVPPIVDEYVYHDDSLTLPLPTPIAGLLMPANDEPRTLITPVPRYEDRVLAQDNELTFLFDVVDDKCVEFAYRGMTYRACLTEDDNGRYLVWKSRGVKRLMPIKFPLNVFQEDYDAVVNACYTALGI